MADLRIDQLPGYGAFWLRRIRISELGDPIKIRFLLKKSNDGLHPRRFITMDPRRQAYPPHGLTPGNSVREDTIEQIV